MDFLQHANSLFTFQHMAALESVGIREQKGSDFCQPQFGQCKNRPPGATPSSKMSNGIISETEVRKILVAIFLC